MAVYLDHAATTPMRPEAREAFLDALGEVGNPSSIHGHGQRAKQRLEDARGTIARSLGAEAIEVILTSGGTEAINLGIKGLFWQRRTGDARRTRILVAAGEHHATIDSVDWLAAHEGATVQVVPLDDEGGIDLTFLRGALAQADDVALVSMLWANNEVGTIQPIGEVATIAARAGVPLHVDAVSAFGHVPIDFGAVRRASGSAGDAGLVGLSVSAHKIGGPIASGALVLARTASVVPLQHGGGQQRNVRSGTQDVANAAAFAAAAERSAAELDHESARLTALRDSLVTSLLEAMPDARLNGPHITSGRRLPGNAHLTFPGAQGDSLLFLLDMAGVSVSTGSACTAGIPEPSHVLLAMGRSEQEARSVLRITLGWDSTSDDVDALVAALPAVYASAAKAGHSDRVVVAPSS